MRGVKVTRIEATVAPKVQAHDSCSEFWLVPDDGPEDLTAALDAVAAETGLVAWGFLGLPARGEP